MKIKISILLIAITISFVNAQDNNITKVSNDACLCIGGIDLKIKKLEANEKIKSCISQAIITNQINEDLLGKLNVVMDSIVSSKKEITSLIIEDEKESIIVADKNYDEIEEYLLRNCQQLKILISSDNTKLKNSISNNKKALKFYDQGVDYLNIGDYKKALPKFKKAVKEDDSFAFAWDNLGMCQRKTGKYNEAVKSYNKSLKLDPNGRMPLMNIPVAYEYLKDYDNAIIAYKEFSKKFADDPEGYYGIARMYHFKGDYENALENIFKAYTIYNEIKSPYVRDAKKNISIFYNEMKEKGLLETFNRVAEKYNVKISE